MARDSDAGRKMVSDALRKAFNVVPAAKPEEKGPFANSGWHPAGRGKTAPAAPLKRANVRVRRSPGK